MSNYPRSRQVVMLHRSLSSSTQHTQPDHPEGDHRVVSGRQSEFRREFSGHTEPGSPEVSQGAQQTRRRRRQGGGREGRVRPGTASTATARRYNKYLYPTSKGHGPARGQTSPKSPSVFPKRTRHTSQPLLPSDGAYRSTLVGGAAR